MELVVARSHQDLSTAGAKLVIDLIRNVSDARIVVATGNTPMDMYRELAVRYRRDPFDSSALRVFQLDDYLGLGPDDPRSLYGWMKRSFLDPLGIHEERVVRLRGDVPDPGAECRTYDEAVANAGGFDLAILGLGPNGHLGFNEPPAGADAPTRVVDLAPESIESNARYWGGRDRVPKRALTAGMTILLKSRATLLLVSGVHKAGILRRTVERPTTPDVPATYLQEASNVAVHADQEAASELVRRPPAAG